MPLPTFFNLSMEKQETIITAALREFARVPFPEASIANIVKTAEISRGSFYQYFDDKEDLFFYLLNRQLKERQTGILSSLENNDGDIFKTMSEMFHLTLKELDNVELRDFYRNVFLHLNYKTEKTIVNSVSSYRFNNQYEEIKPFINTTNLNVDNDEELFHVVQIISIIMMHNFVLKFAKGLSNDEIIKQYQIQLNLFKKGFIKNIESYSDLTDEKY